MISHETVVSRVIVLGLGKSGTTALFTAIRDSLPLGTETAFEPRSLSDLPTGPLVVKMLVDHLHGSDHELIGAFDRAVLILRDPRDVIVSRLLYRVRDMQFAQDEVLLASWFRLLERKEENPASVSLLELNGFLSTIEGGEDILEYVVASYEKLLSVKKSLADVAHPVRYEDFVQGNTTELREYLGLDIKSDVEVDPSVSRVSRTQGAGDWQNWFTLADRTWSNRVLATTLDDLGYERATVNAKPPRSLNPSMGSKYVERILTERHGAEKVRGALTIARQQHP